MAHCFLEHCSSTNWHCLLAIRAMLYFCYILQCWDNKKSVKKTKNPNQLSHPRQVYMTTYISRHHSVNFRVKNQMHIFRGRFRIWQRGEREQPQVLQGWLNPCSHVALHPPNQAASSNFFKACKNSLIAFRVTITAQAEPRPDIVWLLWTRVALKITPSWDCEESCGSRWGNTFVHRG